MEELQKWLRGAESLLANFHLELGSAERIKAYGEELQVNADIAGVAVNGMYYNNILFSICKTRSREWRTYSRISARNSSL